MDNERKYTTSLRLYKERPVHAQAYRCLKNYNRDIFKTKDDFIAEAIIHFSRYLKQEEEEKTDRGIKPVSGTPERASAGIDNKSGIPSAERADV